MRDRATAYAERVVSGDVVAGELHVQACRRHLRDLERQGTDEFRKRARRSWTLPRR